MLLVINVIDIVFFAALIYNKNLPACILILGALFFSPNQSSRRLTGCLLQKNAPAKNKHG